MNQKFAELWPVLLANIVLLIGVLTGSIRYADAIIIFWFETSLALLIWILNGLVRYERRAWPSLSLGKRLINILLVILGVGWFLAAVAAFYGFVVVFLSIESSSAAAPTSQLSIILATFRLWPYMLVASIGVCMQFVQALHTGSPPAEYGKRWFGRILIGFLVILACGFAIDTEHVAAVAAIAFFTLKTAVDLFFLLWKREVPTQTAT
jgi:hypothetical protein